MKEVLVNKTDKTIYYQYVGDVAITEDDAKELQRIKGYHPAGYGFYSFKVSEPTLPGALFIAKWNSQASCD